MRYLRFLYSKLVIKTITLLGFSCTTFYACEYGMPNADFKAKGTIIDEQTQEKIKGIQVVMDRDTVYSDSNGNYEIMVNASPSAKYFTLHFKDVDGAENGKYLSKDSVINYSEIHFENPDADWYEGVKTKEVNVKLKPEED